MDQREQNVRQAAAEAFVESLDQLEETLLSDDATPSGAPSFIVSDSRIFSSNRSSTSPQSPQCKHLNDTSMQAFADAAEEIEQFMQARH